MDFLSNLSYACQKMRIMKQFLLNLKVAMTTALIVLPMLAIGQDQTGTSQKQISFTDQDNLFIYTTSYSSGSIYNQGPVGQVLLSVVSDEIIIKKQSEVTQEKIENTVLSSIPTAQISWVNDNVCTVIADEQSIGANMSVFMADDDMISVRPTYIRKDYKDLMELYTVKQVTIYGFTDVVYYLQQKYTNDNEVDSLLSSFGYPCEVVYPGSEYGGRAHNVYVPKDVDVISIANTLYETGFFYNSAPYRITTVRETNLEPVDLSVTDFIYDSKGNKVYLYTLPGQFMITKDSETSKAEIEAIINKYLTNAYYEWIADDRCQIATDESLVDEVIAKIRNEKEVASANRSYLKQSEYEWILLNGTDYPGIFNFNQNILVNFNDGVSEAVKDSLRNAFNLTLESDRSEPLWTTWLAPKTADVLKICNSIYESGYVKWVDVTWVSGFKIHWNSSGSVTTDIKRHEVPITVEIVSESYFNLLGRHIDSPSGLTIVVTRYSDGSVSTEKKLFR